MQSCPCDYVLHVYCVELDSKLFVICIYNLIRFRFIICLSSLSMSSKHHLDIRMDIAFDFVYIVIYMNFFKSGYNTAADDLNLHKRKLLQNYSI